MNPSLVHCGPYAHDGSSVSGIMMQLCLALLPCTLFAFYIFSWPAIFLFVVCCGSALIFEAVCLYMRGDSIKKIADGSALVCAWLLALTLPPWAPWWIGITASFFAIVIGKQLYGGLGQNIFNPAMLARTALLITFPVQMTSWYAPMPFADAASPGFFQALALTFSSVSPEQLNIDAYSGATVLGELKTSLGMGLSVDQALQSVDNSFENSVAMGFDLSRALMGFSSGSMGETSELMVLIGGIFLLWRGIISWEIPVAMLAGVALFSEIAHLIDAQSFAGAKLHLSSGGLLLAAFFIATDPVTSPSSRSGKLVFGSGCALLIFIIRNWGAFPEAVAFSVLIMNAFNPLIERYFKPRVYGRLPNKQALPSMSSFELAQKLQRQK
ncbi:RnfABCDGE type electron transport complex subunit D [Agaribacterium haliotis]|uniref:RnfABCDGE type electron transport complex subunit D n=1 Tax=Agaribacterium haliotis TaxID=2013869 RepID=UPI000BB558C8|nr:RnfABCDGE type electron transport complex subunit D [Agaribacterium haliotis]